jgi:AcrR family transcriptional regulator
MSSLEIPSTEPGLRERKKQQTREAISSAALRLFAERGYDETTLADIAEAAGVAPRTIFAYFDSKEDILLCDDLASLGTLKQRLEQRAPDTTTVDVIREFLSTVGPPDKESIVRKKIVMANPALQMKTHARHAWLEPMLAESIAKDLGSGPDDIRPLLIAASMTTAFKSISDRFAEAEAEGQPLSHEEGMAVLDQVLEFLRGGLEALQRG